MPTARPSILLLTLLVIGLFAGCKRYQRVGECREVIGTVNQGLERLERMTAGETLIPLPPPPLPAPSASASASSTAKLRAPAKPRPAKTKTPGAKGSVQPKPGSAKTPAQAKPRVAKPKSAHKPKALPNKPKPVTYRSKHKRPTTQKPMNRLAPITGNYGPPEPPYEPTPEMLTATEQQEKKYKALAEELSTFNLRVVRAPLTDKPLVDWSKSFGNVLTAEITNARRYSRELAQHLGALKSGDKNRVERSEARLKRTRDLVKRRRGEYKKFRASLNKYCRSSR